MRRHFVRIHKIKLYNYRQYYGEQIINIPPDGKIVILRGENGAGKTNLINGLTWCLYNEETNIKELINDKAISDAKQGSNIEMFIELHFDHDGISHILKRLIIAKKNLDNSLKMDKESKLDKMRDGTQETIKEEIQIDNYINNILNESVKNYFFFDGARIETFTRDDHNKDVEKAIKHLLKIDTIKRAKDHIHAVIKDITNSIGDERSDGTIEGIKTEISKIDDEIKFCSDELSSLSTDISDADRDIENTEKEIKHIEQNSLYKEKKSENQNKRDEKQAQLNEKESVLKIKLKNAYVCFASTLLDDALQVIRYEADKTRFPVEVIKAILTETLDHDVCYICEEPLRPENKESLLLRRDKIVSEGDTSTNFLNLSTRFTSGRKEAEKVYQDIKNLKMHINDYVKEIEGYDEVIAKCDSMITDELPDIKEHKDMLKKLKEVRDHKREQKTRVEDKVTSLEQDKKNKEKEHIDKVKELSRFNSERDKLSMSYKIRDELEKLYSTYERTEIPKINDKTKEIFDCIIHKKDVFKNIFIDKDYKINVNREFNDDNILKQLSYGERQILSLSLILALAKVSGDQGPFVMDTPMGNLDPIHRQKLIKNIPVYVSQLFLLVTSSEFTEDLHDICAEHISTIYKLNTVADGMTKIKQES